MVKRLGWLMAALTFAIAAASCSEGVTKESPVQQPGSERQEETGDGYDRDDFVQSLVDGGVPSGQANCIADGVEGRIDLDALENQDELTESQTAILTRITQDCIARSDSGTGDATGYDETTRLNFLDACTAEADEPVRPVCECIYNELVAKVPYERFVELDQQLTQQSGDLPLPADIAAIVDGCAATTDPP